MSFILGLLKLLAGVSESEIQNMSRALNELQPKRLNPWQGSQIYHALTQQKTVVSSKELSLDHILGDTVVVSKSDKQTKDLYYAMDMLVALADKGVEYVIGALKHSWQHKVANLPQSWPALVRDAEMLQISCKGASVLKHIPWIGEIPRVPTNNATRTLLADAEKVAWDCQVRDVMCVLATAKILHGDTHRLDLLRLETSSAQSLFHTTLVLLASLSLAIERSRKQAVNKAIAESSTLNRTFFGKEGR